MTEDSILRIILRFGLDQPSSTDAKAGVDSVTAALKVTQAQAASATAEMRQLRMVARELNQVAMLTIAAGTAIAGPFVAAAAKYISSTGQLDGVSRDWLGTLEKINRSTNDIGRVAASVLLPGLKEAESVSEKIATFLEANPGVVEAALKIGATVIAIGTVAKIAAEGIKFYADVNLILAAATQNTAADTMLAAANIQAGAAAAGAAGSGGAQVAGGAATVAGGITLGGAAALAGGAALIGGVAYAVDSLKNAALTGVIDAIANVTAGDVSKLPETAQVGIQFYKAFVIALSGGSALDLAFTSAGIAQRAIDAHATAASGVGPLQYNPAYSGLDASDRAAHRNDPGTFIPNSPELNYSLARTAALPVYNAYSKASAGNLDSYQTTDSATRMAFLKSSEAAEAGYNSNRLLAIRNFGEQSVQIEKSYNETRQIQIRNFNEQSKQLESSYNDSRLKAIRNFAEQQANAAESFNDSQTKALDAHNLEMARLAADHATAMAAAADTHNQSLHDLAASGNALGFVKEQESYAKSKAAAEKAYALEVSRKNADFAKSSKDAQANYDEQRKLALAAFQQSQDDAAKAYQDQKDQRDKQFAQQLDDAAKAYQDAKDQRAFQFAQQQQDAQNAFDDQQRQARANFKTALDDNQKHYDAQQTQLTQAFTDQLNAIDPILTGMTTSVQTNMQNASDEFAKYLQGVVSQIGGGPGYCGPGYHWDAQTKSCVPDSYHGGAASGGYVGYGMRMLGEKGGEFVLSNQTMTAAERLGGGPLTQDKILAMLAGGGGQSFNVNLGGVSGHWGDKATALEGTLALVDARISDAFDQFGQELGQN